MKGVITVYYRYEVRFSDTERWRGFCAYLNPSERRKIAQWLSEPKWYAAHPNVASEAWFTEYGFQKYRAKVEDVFREMARWRSGDMMKRLQVRLRKQKSLSDIVSRGKVQCVSVL